MDAGNHESGWALDREIVLSRVYDAPRALVFEAWTKVEHLSQWFGPRGYTVTTHEAELRVGGRWRFVMHGPDGRRFDSRIVFLEVAPPERIVFDHGSDRDDDPSRFRVTVTFDVQRNGKTVVTLRQLHPTAEQRAGALGFGAVELGYQTLEKLAEHLRSM